MIDHMAITVSNYEECKAFYKKILSILGFGLVMDLEFEGNQYAGFGLDKKPVFWLYRGVKTQPRIHVAFQADSREKVDEFYEAAIKAGGIDNGKPGIREHYHPNYYGAFVLDPDGHNVEAVCHNLVK